MDYGARPKVKQEMPEEIVRGKGECLWTHRPAADPRCVPSDAAKMRQAIMLQAAEAGFAPPFAPRSEFVHQHIGADMMAHVQPGTTHSRDDVKPQVVNKHGGAQTHSECIRDSDKLAIKTPRFSGKTDWDAFKAQFELLADAAGWSEKHKALQLALCLTDDAAACLLLLSPAERNDYNALVGALHRRFGQCSQPVLLRTEFHNRNRQQGEPLRILANDIECLCKRAYADMPSSVQNELARDRFIQALSPRELRVQTQLAHPTTLSEALELAIEREILGAEIVADKITPIVRAAEMTELCHRAPAWMDNYTNATTMRPGRSASEPRPRRRLSVCWGCGQPGHLIRQCPRISQMQGNAQGPV